VDLPSALPLAVSLAPMGLSAGQVRQAYGLGQVRFQTPGGGSVAGDGSGQTIAIVVAYDSPSIAADLHAFDQRMGLPDPPSLTKYQAAGLTQTDPGWSLEAALDVEWAHAMAPGASIALVEAGSASLSDLFSAVNFARNLNGVSVVSMSWGTGEFYGQTAFDSLFTTPAGHVGGNGQAGGVSFVAASGDSGAWSGVSYPASSPNVLSVGATRLSVSSPSGYGGETAWAGSTGGFSALEPAPAYQAAAQASSGLSDGLRTVPDVAAVGDPGSGVSAYSSAATGGSQGWLSVGGTSAAAPQWAGLLAVADQGLALAGKGSLSNAQAAVYSIPSTAFHDVTSGSNGYSAKTGYDLVTGRGTPIASQVVSGLLATQGVHNVVAAPAPAPAPPRVLPPASTHLVLIVGSGGSNGASGGTGSSTSSTATTTTPVLFSSSTNVTVIVVTIGTNQIVVIVPLASPTTSAFASASHPVQPQSLPSVALPGPSLSVFDRFGQHGPDDPALSRRFRLSSDLNVSALVDLVEPSGPEVAPPRRPDAPAPAQGVTAASARRAPFLAPAGVEVGLEKVEMGGTSWAGFQSGSSAEDHDVATPLPGIAPRLAAAGALSLATCAVALRESRSRGRDHGSPLAGRRFKPTLRRQLLPGR
jgi:hypothetical protein